MAAWTWYGPSGFDATYTRSNEVELGLHSLCLRADGACGALYSEPQSRDLIRQAWIPCRYRRSGSILTVNCRDRSLGWHGVLNLDRSRLEIDDAVFLREPDQAKSEG